MKSNHIIAIILVIVIGAVGFYTITPLFTETALDEEFPRVTDNAKNGMNKSDMDSMPNDQYDMTSWDMEMEEMMHDVETRQNNEVILRYMGTFVGKGDGVHNVEGTASVYSVGDSSVLRLEDFVSTNGPGLRVYFATDIDAKDYVSLGVLKASRGNQNYDIPAEIDLEKYNQVLIWCEPFRVLFGSSQINPT